MIIVSHNFYVFAQDNVDNNFKELKKTKKYGFSLEYPSDWKISYKEFSPKKLYYEIVIPEIKAKKYGVYVWANKFSGTLEEFKEKQIDEEKKYIKENSRKKGKFVKEELISLGDQTAYKLEFKYNDKKGFSHNDVGYIAYNNGIGYQIWFDGREQIFKQNVNLMQKMIHSFKFVKSENDDKENKADDESNLINVENLCARLSNEISKRSFGFGEFITGFTEKDCHDMFDKNSIKVEGGLFISCKSIQVILANTVLVEIRPIVNLILGQICGAL